MPTRHDKLLELYAADLRKAKDEALRWWKALAGPKDTRDPAQKKARRRWPAGPASHPRVIAVVRDYWFRCEALNAEIEKDPKSKEQTEYPHLFLADRLLNGKDDDLAMFVGGLPYWPIGSDKEGNRE